MNSSRFSATPGANRPTSIEVGAAPRRASGRRRGASAPRSPVSASRRGRAIATDVRRVAGGRRVGGDREPGALDTARRAGRPRSSGGVAKRSAEVREALADQALGRVDQQDRGLQPAPPRRPGRPPSTRARGGGPGYVSWATHVDEVGGAHRQVGVDVDARPEPALVPVVAAPRLVADEPERRSSPAGSPKSARRPSPEPLDQPVDDAGRRSTGIVERVVPGGQPVGERPRRARAHRAPTGRASNTASSRRTRRQREAARRRDRRTAASRPRAPRACVSSATSWRVEPVPPLGRPATSAARRSRSAAASSASARRRAQLLHVDLRLEVGRAEVAVDQARDVLLEPERRAAGSRGRSGPAGTCRAPPTARVVAGPVVTSVGLAGQRAHPLTRPIPRSSPTNGIPWRSTASRLIRAPPSSAAATSRT